MSDYIYMLESHLNPDQNRVVEEVQTAAGQAVVNVFLTGGAMRDMLAGFRIRDLDFVVEGNAAKLAKTLCETTGAKLVSSDENRKSAELVFPSGVTAQIAMSRPAQAAATASRSVKSQALKVTPSGSVLGAVRCATRTTSPRATSRAVISRPTEPYPNTTIFFMFRDHLSSLTLTTVRLVSEGKFSWQSFRPG